MALGFGATNVAVLRRLGSGEAPASEQQSQQTATPVEAADAPTASAPATVVSEPAAPPEPPPVPVLDESAAQGTDQPFDLAIVGGRVIDPASGFDYVASIGISGSTVAAISADPEAPPLQAATTIDATGLVVSPGFIDILSYSPNGYGEWFKLADGVTTNLGMHGLDNRATNWFAAHPDGSSPIHFGGASDHAFVRQVHGLEPYDTASGSTLEANNDLSMTNIVCSTLFGDGVAATVISGKLNSPEPLPAMQRCTTRFFPGTLDYMGFELRNEGLRIILSPEIPPFIKKRIKPTLEGFLQECQLSAESLSHFVMHPGSVRIVEIIANQLGLSREDIEPTLKVLFNKGNMSSVTVLAVMQEIQNRSAPQVGDLGLMVAFGPGFVAEMALFEWLNGRPD